MLAEAPSVPATIASEMRVAAPPVAAATATATAAAAPAVSEPAAIVQPAPEAVAPPAPKPAPIDLERVLKESGLQLVETKPGAPVEAAMPEPQFVPAKRERRPPPADLNLPLQQVETHKK